MFTSFVLFALPSSKSPKEDAIHALCFFDPVDEELAPLSFPVCSFFQDKFNSLTSLPECRNVFEVLKELHGSLSELLGSSLFSRILRL